MMRRFGHDARAAAVLLAASTFFLVHLLMTPASGGGFVSTTTLPTAVAAAMTLLAALLLVWSLARPAEAGPQHGEHDAAARWRPVALVGWTVLDIALMPSFGYLATTAVYIAGLAVLFGSRRALSIIAVALAVPILLLLFFERFMIVLLPSARLFE